MALGAVLLGLFGGLALFLYGMGEMTDSLRSVAGGRVRALLSRMTGNRFKATLAGFAITSVTQSVSVTTVLMVGFISAGLMTLSQGIGFVFGANVGATITTQIIAFKATRYALVLVIAGVAGRFMARREQARQACKLLTGIGLVFYGMDLMGVSTHPFRDYGPFLSLMENLDAPLYGVLVGAFLTAIVQSSTAFIGIVMVMAGHGIVGLEPGIAMVFGANIGTCVTALLSSVGKPTEAKQAAMANLLFNLVGAVIWFPFMGHLAGLVRWLEPTEGMRQIAHAHTLFNVATMLFFMPMAGVLAWMSKAVVPERKARPRKTYLDPMYLDQSDLALDRARMELGLMGEQASRMLSMAWDAVIRGEEDGLRELERMDDDLDAMHEGMVSFLGQLSMREISQESTETVRGYLQAANCIEGIGDIVETDMVAVGRDRLSRGLSISSCTQDILRPVYESSCRALGRALACVVGGDDKALEEVSLSRGEFGRMAEGVHGHLSKRLVADAPKRMATFRMESNIVEACHRVHDLARRLATS